MTRELVQRLRSKHDDYEYRRHGHGMSPHDEGYLRGLSDAITMLERALGYTPQNPDAPTPTLTKPEE